MPDNHRFQLVDVFGEQPFSGNPLAVVFDADDLSTEQMLAITRWLNLSETAFLLAPANPLADYRLRIFTLDRELPFAGHPTLGGCHAWLSGGGKARHAQDIVMECSAGLIPIRRSDTTLAFAAPPVLRSGSVEESALQEVARFLHIERSAIVDAQWADNGPGWMVVLLESSEAVLALEPRRDYPARIDLGVVGLHPAGSPAAYELRAFLTDHHGAVREDPVTGSLNASTAQWLLASGRVEAPYLVSQGGRVGRTGRIHISTDSRGAVWVGGKTITLFSGVCGF